VFDPMSSTPVRMPTRLVSAHYPRTSVEPFGPEAAPRRVATMPEVSVEAPRAWVEFTDPANDGQVLRCDLTWLTSRYGCIFGDGCPGIYTGRPDDGCCTLGAHFADKADEKRVGKAMKRLTADEWQLRREGRKGGWVEVDDEGERKTRVVDGACIFLNRPGFARGPGCALHVGALDAGERPLDWKPDVCWQLPLRREDVVEGERVTSTVRQWDRVDWGEGGGEFHWWCTESPEAFVGAVPVYAALRDELVELTTRAAYALVAAHCEARLARAKPLAHPAARRRP